MKDPDTCPTCIMLRLAALLLWAGAIAWLSLTSSPPKIDSALLGWDKLRHAAAYGLLALLAARALRPINRTPTGAGAAALVLAVGYGGLLEIAQLLLTPNRVAEWGDLLADLAGAAAALAAFSWLQPRRRPVPGQEGR